MVNTPLRVLQLHTPREIRAELERVGADSAIEEKVARARFSIVKLEHASLTLARLLFQELTMEGGQAVTAPRLEHVGEGETDVLLCGTRYQFNHLLVRLRWQPSEELEWLADELERALDRSVNLPPPLEIGKTTFDWTRTVVMGILNVTPDSFSGDALWQPNASEADTVARVVARARQLADEGADILDLGGESTRPDAMPVPAEIELQRVLPALRALRRELDLPISVDTSKARVADAALDAGANLVNDVMGFYGDPEMRRVVAAHDVPVVVMHNWLQGQRPENVGDVIGVIIAELRTQIEGALAAGIAEKRILIDPGLGFGKAVGKNLELLNRLGEFRSLGFPILIGPSRKGFISKATGVDVTDREAGTAAAVTAGILRGANLIRVHNVKMMAQVARMTDAIRKQV